MEYYELAEEDERLKRERDDLRARLKRIRLRRNVLRVLMHRRKKKITGGDPALAWMLERPEDLDAGPGAPPDAPSGASPDAPPQLDLASMSKAQFEKMLEEMRQNNAGAVPPGI